MSKFEDCSITEQQLDKALERSYGLQFNLKLTIDELWDKSLDEVLSKYKDRITFLEIPFHPYNPKYLKTRSEFKNLNGLVIKNCGRGDELDHKVMVGEMLSKYGEQLEHLGLTNIKHFESYCMVPNLPRLKSLDLNHVEINIEIFYAKSEQY